MPDSKQNVAWRVVDANLNRCREGLRVIEEIARFGLNSERLTGRLKDMRHRLGAAGSGLQGQQQLLGNRDSEHDVGAESFAPCEKKRLSILDIAVCNFKRVQEGLRVLEEFSKLTDENAARAFKNLRFQVYILEKEVWQEMTERRGGVFAGDGRQGDVPGIDYRLYVITDRGLAGEGNLLAAVEGALKGGAGVIQLREKDVPGRVFAETAKDVRRITRRYNAAFIVNDRADIALLSDADGLHIGQEDIDIEDARRLLGKDRIIGVSTHTREEAIDAEKRGADYIGVGSVYETGTKRGVERILGPEAIGQIKSEVCIPVVAIGGIDSSNAARVIRNGPDGIAVISAVMAAPDPESAARDLMEVWRTASRSG